MKRQNLYPANICTSFNQHPFGMLMPERSFSSGGYRYGFNGQINELALDLESEIDFGERLFNKKISRFLSRDPFFSLFPSISPYSFAGNDPIAFIDAGGLLPELGIIPRDRRYRERNSRTRTDVFYWNVSNYDGTNFGGASPVAISILLANLANSNGQLLVNFANARSGYTITSLNIAITGFEQTEENHTDDYIGSPPTWIYTPTNPNPTNIYNIGLNGTTIFTGGKPEDYRAGSYLIVSTPSLSTDILSANISFGRSKIGQPNTDGCYGFTIKVKVKVSEKRILWEHIYVNGRGVQIKMYSYSRTPPRRYRRKLNEHNYFRLRRGVINRAGYIFVNSRVKT